MITFIIIETFYRGFETYSDSRRHRIIIISKSDVLSRKKVLKNLWERSIKDKENNRISNFTQIYPYDFL